MPFEVFDKRRVAMPSACRVTIQSRGVITFNQWAYEALDRPSALNLLFDNAHQRVGLQPVDPENPTAYPVRQKTGTHTYLISGLLFAHHYDIPLDKTRTFKAKLENGILCVDLREGEET